MYDYGLGLGNPFADGKTYSISSPSGPRKAPTKGASTWHQGTDYVAPRGTKLVAPLTGTVTVIGRERGYGNRIGICDNKGRCVHLAHMDTLTKSFRPGQTIQQGTHVGTVGNTGRGTGVHLDYTVTLNGKIVSHTGKVWDKMATQSYLAGKVKQGGTPKNADTTALAQTTPTDVGVAPTITPDVSVPDMTAAAPYQVVPVAQTTDWLADINKAASDAVALDNYLSPTYQL